MGDNLKYSKELVAFIEQAKTGGLKTKHYLKSYLGTSVRVSFGQGASARVPWISFLREPFTTSDGIYPVYLFYKKLDLLILAYGVSETNAPSQNWSIKDPETITEYFNKNNLGKPDRYGASYLYKVYDLNQMPELAILDKDLDELISYYLNINMIENETNIKPIAFNKQNFLDNLKNSGLIFESKLASRFISSLLTKPFVILTGLSGSGKTKLAQAFVQWICQDESQYCIVPVGADWTNREPLLGYPNALNQDEYIKPDNGALDLIIEANNHPELPYFLILDEMNLSHVERYFADFLSVMESQDDISLYAEGEVENNIPAKLSLPSNLFIIGTVNIDETTYMFSPKVLDRANTIEFRVTKGNIEAFFKNQKELDMEKLNTQGTSMAKSFLDLSENKEFKDQNLSTTHDTLIEFFEQLKNIGAEFGYRSAMEITRLINQLTVIDNELTDHEKLDIAIMQKLLPKLHGSRRKLAPALITLGNLCIDNTIITNLEKDVYTKEDFEFESMDADGVFKSTDGVLYPLALEKLTRMYKSAMENGFASYAEA